MKPQLTIIAVFTLLIFSGCQHSAAENNEAVRVGAVLPLTGNLAFLGDDYQNSLQLATEEINANGGINGKKIELFFEDGRGEPRESLSAARSLRDAKGVTVIVTAFRGPSLAIASGMETDDVIVIANTATSKRQSIGKKNFFPIGAEMVTAGETIGYHIEQNKLCQNIALLSENTDAGKDKILGVKRAFSGNVTNEEYADPNEADYRTILAKIKTNVPDCIFFELRNKNTPTFLKQMNELGIKARLFANSYAATEETINSSPSNIQGMIVSTNRFSPNSTAQASHYIIAYRERFGQEPTEFGAAIYDAVYIIKEAGENCTDAAPSCMAKNIRLLRHRQGVLGNETISASGDILLMDYTIKQVKGNTFEDVDW